MTGGLISNLQSYQDDYSVQPVALSDFDQLDTDWLVKSYFTDNTIITELLLVKSNLHFDWFRYIWS